MIKPPIPELSVIVPTLNESGNISLVIAALTETLDGIAWEVVFVDDDSTDTTRQEIAAIAAQDPRVRMIHRIGRRGLSSACIEGAMSGFSPYIAVTDADLQHDVRKLPAMLDAVKHGQTELAIGSRYVTGGNADSFSPFRSFVSEFASKLARFTLKTQISDPMSGFFLIRRAAFDQSVRHMSGFGFKILLDIIASAPKPLVIDEFAYHFRDRQHGESKLDSVVVTEYLALLADKKTRGLISLRFIMFVLVGATGLLVHMLVLFLAEFGLKLEFTYAQTVATLIAMIYNFSVNNRFTYRDQRLQGKAWLIGLMSFMVVCGIGGIANVGVASRIFSNNGGWWISGIAGALVSSVWNYGVTSLFTWKKRK
ncbi:MAG: glycosyltransferase family 2 protein [Alphaproteobacteria bacterium]|nr:glycosyltransferase family 2 protein [Alphaproteobacteria bacterium]